MLFILYIISPWFDGVIDFCMLFKPTISSMINKIIELVHMYVRYMNYKPPPSIPCVITRKRGKFVTVGKG